MQYADHLQSIILKGKATALSLEMHQKLIVEGILIMEDINDNVGDSQKPFSI